MKKDYLTPLLYRVYPNGISPTPHQDKGTFQQGVSDVSAMGGSTRRSHASSLLHDQINLTMLNKHPRFSISNEHDNRSYLTALITYAGRISRI
jgi:hypothetical protein